jgi:predicted amidohydrolase
MSGLVGVSGMKKVDSSRRSRDSRAHEGEVTLGLVQMAMGDDRDANISKAVRMIREASARGASIVCLPELFASRYFPQDKKANALAEPIPGPTTRRLAAAALESKVTLVGGSLYEKASGGHRYNTSVVFDETGRILGKYRKVQVPEDESFYEKDYFSSGKAYSVFRTASANLGVLICFDQWYPEPARVNKLMGAEVLFYPTAIGRVDGIEEAEGDWKEAWEAVQRGHAISNSMVVAAVNRVGREGRMSFWGGSFVCDQFGKILARADAREHVLLASCDLGLGRRVEEGWGFLRNRKPATYRKLVS